MKPVKVQKKPPSPQLSTKTVWVVAQLVERVPVKYVVGGSIPPHPAKNLRGTVWSIGVKFVVKKFGAT